MQVIIDNRIFPYEIGIRVLKTKHGRCLFPPLATIWSEIPELTIGSIVRDIPDLERRRIAFHHLGIEGLMRQLKPVSVGRETVSKTTRWVDPAGNMTEHRFDDTYELFRVDWKQLYKGMDPETTGLRASGSMENKYIVKFRDTTSGKEHLIWVDIRSVFLANAGPDSLHDSKTLSTFRLERLVNPIQAIAWTIVTDLAPQDIVGIIRQGDCVLFRKRPDAVRIPERHLTESEYRSLMRAES